MFSPGRGLAALLTLFALASADAVAAPSDVDTTFGTGGSMTIKPGEPFSSTYDGLLDSGGRVVMVGFQGGSSQAWAIARLTAGGQPDASFDEDGKRTLQVAGGGIATAVAEQGEGKLIVVGTSGGGTDVPYRPEFALARFNDDGSLDEEFGDGGVVRTVLAPGDGWSASPRDVLIQPDGKILVAGSSPEGGFHVTLARYDEHGDPDPGFGNGSGVVHVPKSVLGADADAAAVALDGDGRIVIAGHARDANGNLAALLARFTSGGALDSTFGNGGFRHYDWDGALTKESMARDLIVLPDGKLVVAGFTHVAEGKRMAVARFSGDGEPDSTFGTGGLIRSGGYSEANAVARTGHGKLLVAGWTESTDPLGIHQTLLRIGTDGQVDTGFGTGGAVVHKVPGVSTTASDVLLQPDGRIILIASASESFMATRFVGEPPPDPNANDPGGTKGPEADPTAGCVPELRSLLIVARAACFRTEGAWRTSDARVRINGLDLEPVDGTVIKIDPASLRLRTEAPDGGVGLVDVFAGNVALARTGFDVGLGSALVFRAAGTAGIDDFRITGDVTATFTGEGVGFLTATVSVPGISGTVSGLLSMQQGLEVDTLAIDVPAFTQGALRALEMVRLAYSAARRTWQASARFALGAAQRAMAFTGNIVAANGTWSQITGAVGQMALNGLSLWNVNLTVRRVPGALQINGTAEAPIRSLRGFESFRLEGALSSLVPITLLNYENFDWRLRGTAKILGGRLALANGELRYDNGRTSFSGKAGWAITGGRFEDRYGSDSVASALDATVSATVKYADALASGSGTAKVFGTSFGVDLGFGEKGVAACGDVVVGVGRLSTKVRGGVAVAFDPFRYSAIVGACDIAWLSSASAARASAVRTRPLRVPGGRRVAVLVLRGRGGTPRVRVSGPGGARLTMTAGGKPQRSGRFLVLKEQGTDTTYVLIARPRGGRWSVRPLPGTPAIRSAAAAAALPPIRITGKVTKERGGRRVLRWRGRGVKGHVVQLREVGGGVNRLLKRTRRASGRLTFRPAAGERGARRIVAIAERAGLPRATLRVARFSP